MSSPFYITYVCGCHLGRGGTLGRKLHAGIQRKTDISRRKSALELQFVQDSTEITRFDDEILRTCCYAQIPIPSLILAPKFPMTNAL